ncbi:MAG TPA: GNAT family N-acetyltransferase [Allosphingosinicella sp.]|jgi:CelD/BcsL family acetyltransferase involved in cellulose biosynthesis
MYQSVLKAEQRGHAPAPADVAFAGCREVEALSPELREDWRALAREAAEPNAFGEIGFFDSAWDHLPHAGARLVEVRGGDGMLAGAIALEIAPTLGRMPVRHVENWRCEHDYLGMPLVRRGHEATFWGALLDHLDAAPWAAGLLHVRGVVGGGPVHQGLAAAAAERGRACPVVYRTRRAMLHSSLSPAAYYEQAVRKKKRKEIARLANRLRELGTIEFRSLEPGGDGVEAWCEAFIALECSGWKGHEGSAIACREENARFLRAALAAAHREGRLQIRSLELDGRPIAMLINLLAPPGSFMFKTAYDEDYARFSPGLLLQIENLDMLERPGIDWMDSCAAENHPMIDGLWTERRDIVRVTVRLGGLRRGLVYFGARAAEQGWAAAKRLIGRAQ